jgi:hypothetical protein
MEFTFRDTIKRSWQEYKKNILFFIVLMAVGFLLEELQPNIAQLSIPLFILTIAGILWSYIAIGAALRIVDGEKLQLRPALFLELLPSFRQFFVFLGIVLLTGILYAAGFILLILPGLYLVGRLLFSSFSYIGSTEHAGGVVQSMKYSWHITKGSALWTSILAFILFMILSMIGVVLFRIGEFLTVPIGLLMLAHVFRVLEQTAVFVQAPTQSSESNTETAE